MTTNYVEIINASVSPMTWDCQVHYFNCGFTDGGYCSLALAIVWVTYKAVSGRGGWGFGSD